MPHPPCCFLARLSGLLTFAVAMLIPTLALAYYGPHLASGDRVAESVADAVTPRLIEVPQSVRAGVAGPRVRSATNAPPLESFLQNWTYTDDVATKKG